MKRIGDRLRDLLSAERQQRVPIARKFAEFRTIGAANNAFLENLAALVEQGKSPSRGGLGAVSAVYEALTGPVAAMVGGLVRMSGGRYSSLLKRYEEIDRDLAQVVLRSRPIEFGPAVIWPERETLPHPEEVGPKSARLAEVAAATDLTVPPFFVISSYAYRTFMGATGLQDLVSEALSEVDFADLKQVAQACTRIRDAVEAAVVPADLATEVASACSRLARQHHSEHGFAVRSSAVVEDTAASFAGQFETILNVHPAAVEGAYKRVIASKYRPAAIAYAAARGFTDEDVAMPVLVMPMVQPLASGVAYSVDPARSGVAVVTAVHGLAQHVVDGRVTPSRYLVERGPAPRVLERSDVVLETVLRCDGDSGLVEERGAVSALPDATVVAVAGAAWTLEDHFHCAQDVEWVVTEEGTVVVVQTRPLRTPSDRSRQVQAREVSGQRILATGGTRAAGGTASGVVFRPPEPAGSATVPDGAVLAVQWLDQRLVPLLGRISAIVAATGSPTGHMATVAREFGTPCIVGLGSALDALVEGTTVTVDAWSGTVYSGEVAELLEPDGDGTRSETIRDPVGIALELLTARVAPLTLTDPSSDEFRPANCKTLHDVARFVHQRAMAEMFAPDALDADERRRCRRLDSAMPMDIRVLDLGGGVDTDAKRALAVDEIVSLPLRALLEGMGDTRLRWSGPVGFDLRGFMSVVVRSAADDQRYGEPTYAMCSRDYAHFASRLAYHYATVDSVCGVLVNENYARFLFHGGAAVSERREWRAHFLATVLDYQGFVVRRTGDRVEAILGKRPADVVREALVLLGRLMVAARHLDMVMENRATADLFARAFLSGDYGFERVKQDLI